MKAEYENALIQRKQKTEDSIMRKKCKDSFPAILALLLLLAAEIMNALDLVARERRGDFQTISNILLLMIGVYGLFFVLDQMKTSRDDMLILYVSDFLVAVSAYILNIDVFGNKVEKFSDLLTGWHAMWLLWSAALLLLFSRIGMSSYELVGKASRYLIDKIGASADWVVSAIRKTPKDVFFSVFIGTVLWPAFLAGGYMLGGFSIGDFPKWSLIFWCSWLLFCSLLIFFAKLIPEIGRFFEEFKSAKIVNGFMVTVILLAVAFVVLQIFPSLFQVLGTILSYVLLIILLAAALFYIGKKLIFRWNAVCWCDVCVVLGSVFFVTFILFPALGALSQGAETVIASDQIENLTKFVELFTAGLELVQAFL